MILSSKRDENKSFRDSERTTFLWHESGFPKVRFCGVVNDSRNFKKLFGENNLNIRKLYKKNKGDGKF